MEHKDFSVFVNKGVTKLQIGSDVFALDDNEKKHILECFKDVKAERKLFPSKLQGTAIMYPNGLIAANISVGKFNIAGTLYLFTVYSLKPKSDKYEVNSFMITGEALTEYISILSK